MIHQREHFMDQDIYLIKIKWHKMMKLIKILKDFRSLLKED